MRCVSHMPLKIDLSDFKRTIRGIDRPCERSYESCRGPILWVLRAVGYGSKDLDTT
jgi:hypothetical protein